MNKILCIFQNTKATLSADVWIFGSFGRFSPAAVHSNEDLFFILVYGVEFILHPLSHMDLKKSLSTLVKQLQTALWIIKSLFVFINFEQRRHHFKRSSLLDKCSYKIGNMLPSNNFNSSAISRNFNVETILWTFFDLVNLNVQGHLCQEDDV